MDNVTLALRHLALTCSCSILEFANALSAATFKGLTLDLQVSVGYQLQVSNIYPAISIPRRVCGVEDCCHYGAHAFGLNQLLESRRGTWPGSRKRPSCLCTQLARMILPPPRANTRKDGRASLREHNLMLLACGSFLFTHLSISRLFQPQSLLR